MRRPRCFPHLTIAVCVVAAVRMMRTSPRVQQAAAVPAGTEPTAHRNDAGELSLVRALELSDETERGEVVVATEQEQTSNAETPGEQGDSTKSADESLTEDDLRCVNLPESYSPSLEAAASPRAWAASKGPVRRAAREPKPHCAQDSAG